jgi:hypothetical protein
MGTAGRKPQAGSHKKVIQDNEYESETYRENLTYYTEQDLLDFDKKDCIFCKGKGCDACHRTGMMKETVSRREYEVWQEARRNTMPIFTRKKTSDS